MKSWSGWFCVALLIVLAGCGSNNSSSVTIAISPSAATVLLGTSLQFTPSVSGSTNAVTWSVNGVVNGSAKFGTISSTGLYTAPGARPVSASGVAVPVVLALANASIPNSGSAGAVIELQSGSNFTNFAPGNTITLSGNSVAGWDGSFVIIAAAALPNGNFGVQIPTPAGPPANGVGGTARATPNITITAQVSSTNAIASATVALDSGIRVSFAQPTCTIGTSETFSFAPLVSVSGAPAPPPSTPIVTWSLTGVGSIDATGLYKAPTATTGTATVTATSVADPTESASITVTVATAANPGLTSVSPLTGALGATSLNVYLSGSNFICTTRVFVNVNGTATPLSTGVFSLSSNTLLVVLPGTILSTLPTSGSTVPLTFTVERENGAPQPCSPSPCLLTLSPVRPAIVASKPDSVPLPGAPFNVTLDGGYFGAKNGNALVNVQFDGQANAAPTFNSDRQLLLTVPASDASVPGLYPITVTNTVSGSTNGSMATANLAVQPTAPAAQITSPGGVIGVGTTPSAAAIDTAAGVAVVANQGSNDITIVNLGTLASPSLSIATASLCTGSLAPTAPCVAAGPASVAVDNLRNLALVANSTNATLAVVNLGTPPGVIPVVPPQVTALLSFPSADTSGNPFPLTPQAVAINPVSGRALVAFSTHISGSGPGGSNAGAILDMNRLQTTTGNVTLPPAVLNVVNLNNGTNPHIAVSPKLNWAIATPGGAGSLSIVDLGRQTTNQIVSISCIHGTPSVVSVGTATTVALQVAQPVLVSGVSPSSFNGIFSVTAVSNNSFQYFSNAPCPSGTITGSGGFAAYANPVASLATNLNVRGVSINDETQKALLVDPTSGVPAFVFNILDQTSPLVNGAPQFNNVAAAMNPLTNVGVIVNTSTNQGFLVDPTVPQVFGPAFNTGSFPVDVAIDPAANTALIVNQGSNNVSLFSLGTAPPQQLRSGAPQIIQSSFKPAVSGQTSSRVTISSGLGTPATAQNQTVTLIGSFTNTTVCGASGDCPRLDGDPSPFTGVSISTNGRVMTATLSGSYLVGTIAPGVTRGPRQYSLDVTDSSTSPEAFSNGAPLQVIQAVSLAVGCTNPAPQGVAIDVVHNVALVTEPGTATQPCNKLALVNLATGTGFGATHEVTVGTNPQGVASYPQAGLAVTANAGNDTASIVNLATDAVTSVATDLTPLGIAIDPGTGNALVTASGSNVVDVFPVSASTTAPTPTTIGVQQGPAGVAIDQENHVAVVANTTGNTASVLSIPANAATLTSNLIISPQGVAFDPESGKFLITSGASNQVIVLDPSTGSTVSPPPIRVGIDPSSIAYNFETGTLVTANNLSGTMTVLDFIDLTVRAVFSLQSSTQFAVDIHPESNLAVVADTLDNQLLLVPLPH